MLFGRLGYSVARSLSSTSAAVRPALMRSVPSFKFNSSAVVFQHQESVACLLRAVDLPTNALQIRNLRECIERCTEDVDVELQATINKMLLNLSTSKNLATPVIDQLAQRNVYEL